MYSPKFREEKIVESLEKIVLKSVDWLHSNNVQDSLNQVLEEGADKLTLADMNEESANMLALRTRQNLATNALSLASQANQAILKLF